MVLSVNHIQCRHTRDGTYPGKYISSVRRARLRLRDEYQQVSAGANTGSSHSRKISMLSPSDGTDVWAEAKSPRCEISIEHELVYSQVREKRIYHSE